MNDSIRPMRLAIGVILMMCLVANVLALSEDDKRRYRQEHEQEYENGTLQHHVPFEEMKRRKEARFANDPAVRDCIARASTPPEIGACIDAWRGKGGR